MFPLQRIRNRKTGKIKNLIQEIEHSCSKRERIYVPVHTVDCWSQAGITFRLPAPSNSESDLTAELYNHSECSDYRYASNSESRDIDVGLTGDIGFEWFILPKVSLVATYRMKLLYSWDTGTYEDWRDDRRDKRTSERKSFNLGYENTNLGIAFYF